MIVDQEKTPSPSFDKKNNFLSIINDITELLLMDCESTHVDTELNQRLVWNSLEKLTRRRNEFFLLLDDLFDEAAQSKKITLVIAGRHRNFHLMDLRHNPFHQTKNPKTIDFNVARILLFDSPR